MEKLNSLFKVLQRNANIVLWVCLNLLLIREDAPVEILAKTKLSLIRPFYKHFILKELYLNNFLKFGNNFFEEDKKPQTQIPMLAPQASRNCSIYVSQCLSKLLTDTGSGGERSKEMKFFLL